MNGSMLMCLKNIHFYLYDKHDSFKFSIVNFFLWSNISVSSAYSLVELAPISWTLYKEANYLKQILLTLDIDRPKLINNFKKFTVSVFIALDIFGVHVWLFYPVTVLVFIITLDIFGVRYFHVSVFSNFDFTYGYFIQLNMRYIPFGRTPTHFWWKCIT